MVGEAMFLSIYKEKIYRKRIFKPEVVTYQEKENRYRGCYRKSDRAG